MIQATQIECGAMMITIPIKGACTGDANPDFWFPEIPNGRPTIAKIQLLADQTNYAIGICNGCPEREECLDQGMRDNNLSFGIWGGLMAGERIQLLDKTIDDFPRASDEASALDFSARMEPWIRW